MNLSPIEFINDDLNGEGVIKKVTHISDLKNVFENEDLRAVMPQNTLVYDVQAYFPVKEGTLGGVFFGITKIQPGKVGAEYFMTRGHFHEISDRAEYYWGINGEGLLLLMGRDRNIRAEKMHKGSLHYIHAHTAHRVVNTGTDVLSFGACWPADAGHNYQEIADKGFSGRVLQTAGLPQLIITE